MTLADWTPVALSLDPPVIDWGDLSGAAFREPFFDQTIERWAGSPSARLQRTDLTPLAALDDAPAHDPALLIFHLSRCGSTLLSRLLSLLPGTLVLSEPGPLNALLLGAGDTAEQALLLRRLVRALARPQGDRRVILKLSSWNILRLPLFRLAFPAAALVWVQRTPDAVAASLLADTPGWLSPAVAATLFGIADAPGLPPAELCLRALERLLAAAAAAEPIVIDYNELPDATWTRVAPLVGIAPGEDDIRRLAAEAGFYSKATGRQPFTGDPASRRTPSDAARLLPLYRALDGRRVTAPADRAGAPAR